MAKPLVQILNLNEINAEKDAIQQWAWNADTGLSSASPDGHTHVHPSSTGQSTVPEPNLNDVKPVALAEQHHPTDKSAE